MLVQLSALGDQELAGIRSVVNSAFSRKIMSVDDAGDRNKHAFREYHHDSMKKVKNFWDHADFVCYDNKQGFASWGARNC
ncbi:hypothetical protein GUITHDRAFT_150147 [Guillardia theta CCMP2712]|uniref:Uncharacterized protein n=1 Tax=Guillardia theta (strain CCMP2712) TaxID=905079 RepID=L1K0J5_GUITC|nr:hypothetical protein GUITHDRAFT_150147 [Guillardia theta CCMP2712]EKX54084.1 hypothetical protein GUITHDRAFT_150147 [Guillardia theta CCMP2712]|mmetsp:Transcript_49535/g.155210  ORF Transcript_49535/g.155210 Transcript_49535/m.155210 type:complete len:80 (+) Transcript_49535:40-279(+)|eukprot:XP_005841064.1 hypothetical protein GUITHDRAFT_150147 [Guillardia theta CCMP2712]